MGDFGEPGKLKVTRETYSKTWSLVTSKTLKNPYQNEAFFRNLHADDDLSNLYTTKSGI